MPEKKKKMKVLICLWQQPIVFIFEHVESKKYLAKIENQSPKFLNMLESTYVNIYQKMDKELEQG